MQLFVLKILGLRLRRATALSLVGFLGCVGSTASFRNLEAESIAYKELLSDKWRDELPTAIVLDATDGLHLLKDGRHCDPS